jgi:hypothetical protein
MSFRVTGALLTTALLAATALDAGAAPAATPAPPAPTITTVHRSSGTATHRTRRHAYRHRVPPEGGVYARNAILLDPLTGEVLFE